MSELVHSFWKWRLHDSPEFASFCGIHDNDDKLDDLSEEAFERRGVAVEDFMRKIDVELQNVKLDVSTQHNLSLLKADLETYQSGRKYKGWHYPINFMEGIHVDMHNLINFMKFENEDDFRKYIKRLGCYPKQITQVMGVMHAAMKAGHVHHVCSMEGVKDQLERLLSENLTPAESCFLLPFRNCPETIPDEKFQSLSHRSNQHS